MIWGGELVLRDGAAVGQVTSGAWGETVGGCVGLAYIRHPDGRVLTPDVVRAGEYQVNVGGRLYPATVHLRPPFDPAGDRIKGRYASQAHPPHRSKSIGRTGSGSRLAHQLRAHAAQHGPDSRTALRRSRLAAAAMIHECSA